MRELARGERGAELAGVFTGSTRIHLNHSLNKHYTGGTIEIFIYGR